MLLLQAAGFAGHRFVDSIAWDVVAKLVAASLQCHPTLDCPLLKTGIGYRDVPIITVAAGHSSLTFLLLTPGDAKIMFAGDVSAIVALTGGLPCGVSFLQGWMLFLGGLPLMVLARVRVGDDQFVEHTGVPHCKPRALELFSSPGFLNPPGNVTSTVTKGLGSGQQRLSRRATIPDLKLRQPRLNSPEVCQASKQLQDVCQTGEHELRECRAWEALVSRGRVPGEGKPRITWAEG